MRMGKRMRKRTIRDWSGKLPEGFDVGTLGGEVVEECSAGWFCGGWRFLVGLAMVLVVVVIVVLMEFV